MLPELLEPDHRIIANRLGPAQPRAITWNGTDTWLIG
jgi:hypothetical protein